MIGNVAIQLTRKKAHMKRHLSEPTNERPISIEEDKDRPKLDPIRDDPLMIREPRKKNGCANG